MQSQNVSPIPTVDVCHFSREWQVIIGENGRESVIYFLREDFAQSFAINQRIRLGLPPVTPEAANTNAMIVDLIPALRAFARTFYKNPTDADDLVQDTLTKAIDSICQFTPGTRLKSWLFTIMRNTFCTRVKKYNRERPGELDCVSLLGTSAPSQEWSQTLHEVEEAMLRLPLDQREVLVLVAVLGTTYDDAANICGCAVGTIKSRLSRARENLLRYLGEAQITGLLS